MDVDFANLGLAQQVLDRQEGHARATRDHLEQYARLDGDLGLILQLLQPINEALVDGACQVLDLSAQVYGTAAERMARTREAYVEAERTAAGAVAEVAGLLGTHTAPYREPAAPRLGAAQQGAPERYGEPDGNLFHQAFWDGYNAAEWAHRTGGDVGQRLRDGLASQRSVTEAVAVREFLVAPRADDPEIESIRWKAGLLLGSVDWVFEKLFGYSLLEEITKPFAGNWVRIREASMVWRHTGDALGGMASNTTGLVPPMASWTGAGSEAFLLAAAAVGRAHEAVAGVPGTVATMLTGLVFVSKEIASQIMKLLRRISEKLMRMAVEAAVPVAGWVVAGIEAAVAVQQLVDDVLRAYKLVNVVYDLVSGMVQGQTAVVDSALRMADLAEGLARGAAARV